MSESLKELSDRATPGEWHVGKHFEYAGFFLTDQASNLGDDMDEHDLALICALVNAYRSGQLHDATAIAETRAEGRRQGLNWQPIETAPTDYTEIIGMDAKGIVARTWFFAPSSQTRKWLKVGLPGKKDWHPVLWTHLPLTVPTETQKPEEIA